MTAISITRAVELQQQFAQLNPPKQVQRAVTEITTLAAVGGRVPTDLMDYVRGWLSRQTQQNRYGQ